MPRWAKVVLIAVLTGFALMAAGLIFAGRWVRGRFDSFTHETAAAEEEGRRFGVGRENEACVAEAREQFKGCSFVMCEPKIMIFMGNCLETSTTPPGYCEKIAAASVYDECKRRGWESNERCVRIIGLLQAHCEKPK